MKTLILLLSLGGYLAAQTRTTTTQLTPGEPAIPGGKVYVLAPDGSLKAATLSGLTLACDASGCTLSVAVPQLPALKSLKVRVPTATMASYTLVPSPVGEIEVIRNGITLTEGEDYDVSGAVVTFKPGEQPRQNDLVRFKYR